MQKMNRKERSEWLYFMKNGKRQFCKVCNLCRKECKQSWRVKAIFCPQFEEHEKTPL